MIYQQARMFQYEDLPLWSGGTLHAEVDEFSPPEEIEPEEVQTELPG